MFALPSVYEQKHKNAHIKDENDVDDDDDDDEGRDSGRMDRVAAIQ